MRGSGWQEIEQIVASWCSSTSFNEERQNLYDFSNVVGRL